MHPEVRLYSRSKRSVIGIPGVIGRGRAAADGICYRGDVVTLVKCVDGLLIPCYISGCILCGIGRRYKSAGEIIEISALYAALAVSRQTDTAFVVIYIGYGL